MKSRIIIVLLVFLVSLLFSEALLLAAQFYTSPSGSDNPDGTCTHPFKSIEHALTRAKPGDEIVIMAGEYPTAFDITGLNGTKDKPIVIRAQKNKRVLISPQAEQSVGIKIKDCNYVTLQGLEIKGITETWAIALDQSHFCKIVGNVVHDCKKTGIYLGKSNDNHVLGNICYHNNVGIYLTFGSTRNLVEANVCAFGNASSENADGIGTSDSRQNTYRFNILVGNNDDGLDTWTSKQNTIEYNFACSNGDANQGDGNGFKLGGNWKNQRPGNPWDGGENIVRFNLSCWNLSTGFTDNSSSKNKYEHNVSFGNLNTSKYASVPHCDPKKADAIRTKIRKRISELIDDSIIQPQVHPLPLDVGLIRELKVWP